jgi:predicted transcriptional regulator
MNPEKRRNVIKAFYEYDKIDKELDEIDRKIDALGVSNNFTNANKVEYARLMNRHTPLANKKLQIFKKIRTYKFENVVRDEALWRRRSKLLKRFVPHIKKTFRNMGTNPNSLTSARRTNLIGTFHEIAKTNKAIAKIANIVETVNNSTPAGLRQFRRLYDEHNRLTNKRYNLTRKTSGHSYPRLVKSEAAWRARAPLAHATGMWWHVRTQAKKWHRSPVAKKSPVAQTLPPPPSLPPRRAHTPRPVVPHRVPTGPAHAAITWTRSPGGKINVHRTLANINRTLTNANLARLSRMANENENAFKNYVRALARANK